MAEKFRQEFDENCARIMRVDRFASGKVWIAETFTLREYTLQRETGVKPSSVKFSVINADGPKDVRLNDLVNGISKVFTTVELYQINVVDKQNKRPKGVSSTDIEASAIDVFLKPRLVDAGFELIAGQECHKKVDFYVKNKVTGSTAAVQTTFLRFLEPKGPRTTNKSVNDLIKYAEADVITLVVVIYNGGLYGVYIITPALLPVLRAFKYPERTFQPSPWSLKKYITGSVSELLGSTWVTGHNNVMAKLVAYVTEKTAVTKTLQQASLASDFSPKMAGDHQTRDMLGSRFGADYVDGPVGSQVDGTIHGICCQYKSAKLGARGNYMFKVRSQAGLILDSNKVPVLILAIFEEPVIFIVIATRALTGEPTIGGLQNPTLSKITIFRDSRVKCGFRSSLKCKMSIFVMDPKTDQSADLLIALRECDQRPQITADRMLGIKALELAAVTREQHMRRANAKRKRQQDRTRASVKKCK